MSGIKNHLHNALVATGISNPSYSNASATHKAETSRLANSPNRPADGQPHDISEPSRKFWARNLGAMAGHGIHQVFAAGVSRLAGEYAGLAIADQTAKDPKSMFFAQAAILMVDLARVGYMMKKALDPATEDDANIAYAGAADQTADGHPTDASAAQGARIKTAALYGGMLLLTDTSALIATSLAAVTGDDTIKSYAGQIAKFQVRNAVFASGRDFLQAVGSMVGGGGDNLTFHHTAAPRGAYCAEQIAAGMLMDVASTGLDKNTQRFAHAAARSAINTVPEILDWFALTQKASNLNARHEGLQDGKTLQHFSPSLNKHLRNGDLKKFAVEVGHKFTDQSVVRTGALDLTLAFGHSLEWSEGKWPSKHPILASALNNTLASLVITAFYPRVNGIWQAQGEQRAQLVAAMDSPSPERSTVTLRELLDQATPAASVRPSNVSHHDIEMGAGDSAERPETFIQKETVTGLKSGRIDSGRIASLRKTLEKGKQLAERASASGEEPNLSHPSTSQSARFPSETEPPAGRHISRMNSRSERMFKTLETIPSLKEKLSPKSDRSSFLNVSRRSDTPVGEYPSSDDEAPPLPPLRE